jgi:6-phosphogluconolactonase
MLTSHSIRRVTLNLMLVLGLILAGGALGAAPALAAPGGSAGAVYTQTNATAGNQVLVFNRAGDGGLTPGGAFATGGTGSGSGLGSQGSVTLSRDGRWLFVVNAGSNDISAFRVGPNSLSLVSRAPAGGTMPISVTNFRDLVYVLNAGGSGNISGLRVSNDGHLTPLPGSTRPLSGIAAGPAEVEFSPHGDVLVVTEKNTQIIDTYVVEDNGRAGPRMGHMSNGSTPFGFDFSPRGDLLVTEAPLSAVSSYAVSGEGRLRSISASVTDGQVAACWLVVTNDSRLAFAANAHNNTISSFRIAADGSLSLAQSLAAATDAGPLDLGLTRASKYLYQLASAGATITGFRVHSDGSLTKVGSSVAVPATAVGLAVR